MLDIDPIDPAATEVFIGDIVFHTMEHDSEFWKNTTDKIWQWANGRKCYSRRDYARRGIEYWIED